MSRVSRSEIHACRPLLQLAGVSVLEKVRTSWSAFLRDGALGGPVLFILIGRSPREAAVNASGCQEHCQREVGGEETHDVDDS